MEITWLGHASFKIRTYVPQIGWVTLVTDPYDSEMVGLKFPKTVADIVTVSHEHKDHSATGSLKNDAGEPPKTLIGPGEYEIKGVTIRGIAASHDDKAGAERGENTIFVIDSEGVRVAHLGDLGHKLNDDQLSEMGQVDIVLVPVGGFYTIDAERASEIITQLEPKVVIPMHYKIPGISAPFDQLLPVSDFVKKMGVEPKNMDKFEVKKGAFGTELELVVLALKQ